MEEQVIFYETRSGADIADVIREMIGQAQKNKKGVITVFNDITIAVNPNSKLEEILTFYNSEFLNYSKNYKEKFRKEEKKFKEAEKCYRGC